MAWPLYAPPEATQAIAAHNIFVEALAELGWIGFALLLIFVSGSLSGAFDASSDPQIGWLATGLAGALTSYVVSSLFAGFLNPIHLYVLLGMGAAAHHMAQRSVGRIPLLAPACATEGCA